MVRLGGGGESTCLLTLCSSSLGCDGATLAVGACVDELGKLRTSDGATDVVSRGLFFTRVVRTEGERQCYLLRTAFGTGLTGVGLRAGSGHRRTRRSPGAPSAGGAQKFNSQSENIFFLNLKKLYLKIRIIIFKPFFKFLDTFSFK